MPNFIALHLSLFYLNIGPARASVRAHNDRGKSEFVLFCCVLWWCSIGSLGDLTTLFELSLFDCLFNPDLLT